MLTYENAPTIRHAIMKRLDVEPGVEICDLQIHKHDDHIHVGILALLSQAIITRSHFHLPLSFELRHVHNEIDEIAEQYRSARKDFFQTSNAGLIHIAEKTALGTGLRGRWAQYG